MSTFKIEKNIAMPSHAQHIYPFASMEIGDSFVYADSFAHHVWSAISTFEKANPEKSFITRSLRNGERRCWRVA